MFVTISDILTDTLDDKARDLAEMQDRLVHMFTDIGPDLKIDKMLAFKWMWKSAGTVTLSIVLMGSIGMEIIEEKINERLRK